MKKLFAIFAVALFCIAITADAHVPIGTLSGTVLDAHGQPVSGAAVTIQTSVGTEPYGTHTDAAGHFHINRLESGEYDIRASFAGRISDWTKRVMVHANKTTMVLLRLPPQRS